MAGKGKGKGKKPQAPPRAHPKKVLTNRVRRAAKEMGPSKVVALTTAKQVAYFMMNPSGTRPLRYASPYDGNPSSVVTLFNQWSVIQPTIAGTYGTAGITTTSGIFQAFYFRDPLRSVVYLMCNVQPFQYNATFYVNGQTANYPIPARAADIFPLVPLYLKQAAGSAPHGSVLFCGNDPSGAEGYFWMDFGSVINATQLTANAGDSCQFFAYDETLDVLLATVPFASGISSFTLTGALTSYNAYRGAYVRISYLTGTTPSASQTVGFSLLSLGVSDTFAHKSVPFASTHLDKFSSVRVNAASFLLQNTAAPIYKEGSLQCISVNKGGSWKEFIGDTNLIASANSRNAFRGPLAKGSYSYLHVADRTELEYYSYTRVLDSSGDIVSCSFPLNRCSFVALTAQTVLNGTTFPGSDFFLQHTMAIEFQTTDQWYAAAISTIPSPIMAAALDIVKLETQFFCNPSHLAKLGQFLSGLGGMAKRHAGKIGGALSVLFPQYSSVFSSIAGAL